MNFNNFNMEIEVPVEKNTVSKHSLGFGLGFEDSASNSTKREGGRFGTFSRSESDRSSQNDESGSGSGLENDSLTFIKPQPTAAAAANTLAIPNARAAGNRSANSAAPTGTGTSAGTRSAEDELSHKLPRMLKLAVVGESTAGKTCVCESICSEYPTFSEKYKLTCGVEIYAKTLKVDMRPKDGDNNNEMTVRGDAPSARISGGKSGAGSGKGARGLRRGLDSASTTEKVNLILLDSSGKDIYTELLPKYWGKLDGFVLVVDLTSKLGLENAVPWLELAHAALANVTPASNTNEKGNTAQAMTSIMIGNKSDLKEQCVILSTTAKEFAKKYGLEYFECSVKENRGLQEAFQYIGKVGLNQRADASKRKLK